MITSSSNGGGPKQLFNLAQELSNTFDINVACPSTYLYINELKKTITGKIIIINERKIAFLDILSIIKFILINSVQVVHSHGKGAGAIARLVKVFTGVKLVHTFHGIHVTGKDYIPRTIYLLYEKITLKLNNYNIFVSKSELDMAASYNFLPKRNIKIIANGVAVQNTPLSGFFLKEHIRHSILKDIKKTIVITSSRFVEVKNLFEFIEIASLTPEMIFCMLGDGPLTPAIKKIIANRKIRNIVLTGYKNNIIDYLKSADIYLTTSFREAHPLSVLEAMSVGLPIVASKVPGNIDTISHDSSGYFYDLGNISQAINYLRKISNDYELRMNLGKNAQIIQRCNFSISLMSRNYKDIYNKI
ncbi:MULTISPECIES: glycosyltransferase [Prochlorococcus]|uniref:glycosyltransferase n=1 Tax=Prochlorococcus TaxID=1218 RepID=UPI00055A282D|nr:MULTISPECIES: glycosyltransferase [Prochlorococcus]